MTPMPDRFDLQQTLDELARLHAQSAELTRESAHLHLRTALARRHFEAAQRRMFELKKQLELTRTAWD
jgi:hypothetical protein